MINQWLKNLFRISSSNNSRFVPSNYDKLTRPQLIAKIKALEDQLLTKAYPIKHDKSRPFDMAQYSQQRIALKVAYLGWNYSGFAAQGDEVKTPTVEGHIFKALQSCKLITHPDQCNFTRCGRTDKGVSGLGQVIALNVRSSHSKHAPTSSAPLPYIEILNRLLPDDIRILAWAPVDPSFNARFDCKSRTYKYFFQKGTLDLELMRQAASFMMGSHDFRNFCRLDPSKNITSYERTVVSLDIKPVTAAFSDNEFYQVELKGTAFLWHQVRCIMAILFLVGQKLEKPEVVQELLDINTFPARPEYPMASDLPLLLYDCEFDDIRWIYANQDDQKDVKIPTPVRTWRHFDEFRSEHVIKSLLYRTCIDDIEAMQTFESYPEYEQSTILLGGGKSIRTSHYKALKDRPLADSDQVKKEKYRIKQLKKAEIK
ncbi:tRNA pseudouridine(38/39) synthase-like [Mucor ambiguus]|uniref:tRNA pseudouridine(38/39) synthase-like n=1 Tax=Mucor ambiguus TaxID=91626 RepID=A0A0C9LUL6_9FUNG|nr:tRNA pseudouridine(38/39) synthase-like [Mucor ambiguus]